MARATFDTSAPSPRAALWLTVPLGAASLGVLGWMQAGRLRAQGAADDPAVAVAVLAAGACLAVAGWWIGGLAMLALASAARRLRWAGLERWATRLTPGLVARTAAAVVGIQLAVVAPAHADDAALDPFWSSGTSGTEQLSTPGEQGGGQGAMEHPAPDVAAPDLTVPDAGGEAAEGPGAGAPAAASDAQGPETAAGDEADGSPSATELPPAVGADRVHTPAESPADGTRPVSNPPAGDRVVDGVVTVMAGDTLWDLTAQLLGPDASDAAVSQHLASWLEHNTLAEHGDLIHPGDQLRVPPHLLTQQGARG